MVQGRQALVNLPGGKAVGRRFRWEALRVGLVLWGGLALLACDRDKEPQPPDDPSRYAAAGPRHPFQNDRARPLPGSLDAPEPLPPDAVADALQIGHVCFELPGAWRVRLLPDAGDRRVRWVERVDSSARARFDLMALDLRTRKTELVAHDVGETPVLWGDEVVGRRVVGTRLVELAGDVTPTQSLVVVDRTGAVSRRSAQNHDVRSYAVDVAREEAWYTARSPLGDDLWRTSLKTGAPVRVYEGVRRVWQVLPAGWGLLVSGQGSEGVGTWRLPVGRPLQHLGPDAVFAAAAGVGVMLQDRPGALWRVRLDRAIAEPLPGSEPGDRALPGGQPCVTRRAHRQDRLMAFDGEQLQPLVTVGPVAAASAIRLRGSVVAALLVHDVDRDGDHDPDDEADLCLVAMAVQPVTVPERHVPQRFLARMDAIGATLAAAELAVPDLHFVQRGTWLELRAQGKPNVAPDRVLEGLAAVRQRVAEAAGVPRLGLAIRWTGTDLQAWSGPDGPEGSLWHRVRVADVVLAERGSVDLEVEPLPPAPRKEPQPPSGCSGIVRNLSQRMMDLEVDCQALGPDGAELASRRTPLPRLAVAGAHEFAVPLGRQPPGTRYQTTLWEGDRQVPAADLGLERDARDWVQLLDKLGRELGFRVKVPTATAGRGETGQGLGHAREAFLAPVGFAQLDDKGRDRLTRQLWAETTRHAARHHGDRPAELTIHDTEGRTWRYDGKALRGVEPAP